MQLYIITKDGIPFPDAFTSKKQALINAGISYNNVTRNADTINRNGSKYCLYSIRAHKIKGRGKGFK
jgi:hypothetical protein